MLIRALILYRRRRFINHLLTYLLTQSGGQAKKALISRDRPNFVSFSAPKIRILTCFSQFRFQTKMYVVGFVFFSFSAKKHSRFLQKMCILTVCNQSGSEHQSASNGHVCEFRCNRGWLVSPLR